MDCFIRRIDDISTLGNLFSVENRYVQEWYLKRMEERKERAGAEDVASQAGNREDMQVLVISPVTVIQEQSSWDVRAAVIGGARREEKEVTLCYREAGSDNWSRHVLEHRVRGVYGIRIPVSDLPKGVAEYYVEASDGETMGRHPAAAPQLCAALSNHAYRSEGTSEGR